MTVLALIGAKALYLLFVWLLSAAIAAGMAERKGYGERVGLTFGLLLSVVGLLIVLLLPGRPGSRWKEDGGQSRRKVALREAQPVPSADQASSFAPTRLITSSVNSVVPAWPPRSTVRTPAAVASRTAS